MSCPFTSPLVDLAFLLFPTLWIGLLVGVGFIATPTKFQAQSLSLPVTLDVGRSTFAIWNNVEWVVLAVLAVGAVGILLPIQTMVLEPTLNARSVNIIAGGRLEPSTDHLIYIVTDALKVGVLGSVVWKEIGRLLSLLLQSH